MRQKGGVAIYVVVLALLAAVFYGSVQHTQTPATIETNTPESSDTASKDLQSQEVVQEEPLKEQSISTSPEETDVTEIVAEESSLQDDFDTKSFKETLNSVIEGVQEVGEALQDMIALTENKEVIVTKEDEQIIDEQFSPNDNILEKAGIIYYTNLERKAAGLTPLKESAQLNESARGKAQHMFDYQYFAHDAPTGEDITFWVDATGYTYITSAENLALGGYRKEEDMVQDWMNSEGHRANILNSSFEDIGVGVVEGTYEGRKVWIGVQHFGVPASACPEIDASLLNSVESSQQLVDEMNTTITSLYNTISSFPKPKTQEEYNNYVALTEQYNTLVAKQEAMYSQLNHLIDIYNGQVNAYNACIATK